MASSFPTGIDTFTSVGDGDAVPSDKFQLLQDGLTATQTALRSTTAYTPTWTNGVIGNGSLTGTYTRIGKLVRFEIHMVAGSTTTFGGGPAWDFSLPTAAVDVNGAVMSVHAQDTGTAHYVGVGYLSSTTTVRPVANGAPSGFTSTSPHAWANTDVLRISGWYRVA